MTLQQTQHMENMDQYTWRSRTTATDRKFFFFHDATLSVLLQQTLMFIQAELLPYEFHHQDNDDITMQPAISVLHK